MAQYTNTVTSPFGRQGTVVDVDPENAQVKAYIDSGVLVKGDEGTAYAVPERITQVPNINVTPAPDLPLGADPEQDPEPFNPGEHNVEDTVAYLRENPAQFDAVLTAEESGKARRGILDLDPSDFSA